MSVVHKPFVLMLLALVSGTASGCSNALQTLEDFTRDADTIYIATLLEAKFIPGDYLARRSDVVGKFKVERILKGKISQQFVTLNADGGGGGCSISMIVQSAYLIFQRGNGDTISSYGGSTLIESFEVDGIARKIISATKKSARKKTSY